jgi:hypothetical protein
LYRINIFGWPFNGEEGLRSLDIAIGFFELCGQSLRTMDGVGPEGCNMVGYGTCEDAVIGGGDCKRAPIVIRVTRSGFANPSQ